jgi:SAM-dependent methyltransferase
VPPLPGRPVDAVTADRLNAARWDALADVHAAGTGRFYDTDALVRGESPLWDCERAALARVLPDGVAGIDLLHLQCHLAGDAIHFAREGARVTALDRSQRALAHAARRAAACGVDVRFVAADAAAPPAELDASFDLVWATIGITGWATDLRAWFAAVARMLRPGGRLVLIDVHPVYGMLGGLDPLLLDFPHGGGTVLAFDEPGSYDDPDADVAATDAACVAWSVGEHVEAAIAAGLVLEHLAEDTETEHDPRGLLEPEADGRCRARLHPGAPPLPLLMTLLARRPAA